MIWSSRSYNAIRDHVYDCASKTEYLNARNGIEITIGRSLTRSERRFLTATLVHASSLHSKRSTYSLISA